MKNVHSLTPIPTTNLSDAVYEQLKTLLLDGTLAPGERLNLTELEENFQVSRTPLKTALKRLEFEGFIDIQARRGTFVAQIDSAQMNENYKIRTSFELYVALCLFKYLTSDDYQQIANIQRKMNDLVGLCSGDWHPIIDDYITLDKEFHELLVRVGGPPKMFNMFQQTGIHGQLHQILPAYSARELQAMHFEHEQIFSAIMDQSPERLSASLLNHLESARFRVLSAISGRQDD